MDAPDAPRSRPRRRPMWTTALLAVLALASGAFRLFAGSSLFDRAFGVLLLVLGASFVRELLRERAARGASPG